MSNFFVNDSTILFKSLFPLPGIGVGPLEPLPLPTAGKARTGPNTPGILSLRSVTFWLLLLSALFSICRTTWLAGGAPVVSSSLPDKTGGGGPLWPPSVLFTVDVGFVFSLP